MKKLKSSRFSYFLPVLVIGGLMSACQPDEVTVGNGLSDPNVNADFTVAPVDGQPNRFVLQAETSNVLKSRWDIGDGFYNGAMNENIFLPDAGTYTVSHIAVGRGGLTNMTSQEINVATSDPVAGNIVKGGTFATAEDQAQWTVLKISDSGTSWSFSDKGATVIGGGYNQQAIYQPVEVIAGRNYTIDMNVSGSGSVNTWFEVYASPEKPVEGQDYTAGGRLIGLSTYDGCANDPFNAKLSKYGCVGSGNVVSFTQSGTIYLLIKSGGESLGATGITVTNVEMRGSAE